MKSGIELTNEAQARAIRSSNEWNKPKRKTIKFVFGKLRSLA